MGVQVLFFSSVAAAFQYFIPAFRLEGDHIAILFDTAHSVAQFHSSCQQVNDFRIYTVHHLAQVFKLTFSYYVTRRLFSDDKLIE